MKKLFKVNIDGTYTSIEEMEVENNLYKARLEEQPDEYFKTFAGAKKEALSYMTRIMKDWQYAVSDMRKQTKANY